MNIYMNLMKRMKRVYSDLIFEFIEEENFNVDELQFGEENV